MAKLNCGQQTAHYGRRHALGCRRGQGAGLFPIPAGTRKEYAYAIFTARIRICGGCSGALVSAPKAMSTKRIFDLSHILHLLPLPWLSRNILLPSSKGLREPCNRVVVSSRWISVRLLPLSEQLPIPSKTKGFRSDLSRFIEADRSKTRWSASCGCWTVYRMVHLEFSATRRSPRARRITGRSTVTRMSDRQIIHL